MKTVCLISDHHISTNPRLWKEAISLTESGFEVTALTIFTSQTQLNRDLEILSAIPKLKYQAALNMIPGKSPTVVRFYYKLKRRFAMIVKKIFDFDSPYLLGYAPFRLFKAAKQVNADLYICHIDCAQYVGTLLVNNGKRVAFDLEDWYSKDYLHPLRPVKLLSKIEEFALQNGMYCSVPSNAMAQSISTFYNSVKKPTVIYNGFPKTAINLVNKTWTPSIIWFSQTIGTDRGIEMIFEALKLVKTPMILKLIGDHDSSLVTHFEKIFPFNKGHQLVWSNQIPASALQAEIATHTIGMALELATPESRNTTVTNKILQYLQSGIKVIATETLGQTEVALKMNSAVHLVPFNSAELMAKAIDGIVEQPDYDRKEIIELYDLFFSWEQQEKVFLENVRNSLQ